jgi:hypothetical protein
MSRQWICATFPGIFLPGFSFVRPRAFGPAVGRGCSTPRYMFDLFGLVSKAKGRVLSGLALGMRPLGYVNEKIFVLPFADLAATYSPAS